MLIDHPSARALAEAQRDLGLELAYKANDAHTRLAHARQNDKAAHALTDEDRDIQTFMAAIDATRLEVTTHSHNFNALVNAAGPLIGRVSLGGDALSVEAGIAPTLHADGSHKPQSPYTAY